MTATFDIQDLCGRLDRFEISREFFIEQCTRLMARTVGCTRAGIWLVEDDGEGPFFRCLGLYDRDGDRMETAPHSRKTHVTEYFNALQTVGYVMADDVHTHPATAHRFDPSHPRSVRSLLAAAFTFNGQLYGAFTCSEMQRQVQWTRSQLVALMRIGSRATLALSGASQTRLSTFPMPLM